MPSRADADPASLERDDVTELQLPSAAAVDFAVHEHIAVDDRLFDVSTGVEESGEFDELPEANRITADRDIFDRRLVGHPRMLAEQVPASLQEIGLLRRVLEGQLDAGTEQQRPVIADDDVLLRHFGDAKIVQ